MGKIVFSGIQPSGNLHIGNYIGAIRRWVDGQDDGFNIFCVVDMHAITVPQDPAVLTENILGLSSWLLASGIDPEKSLLFVQSHNPDHANLGWVLNCYASMGQMNRMTQYKEKSDGKDFVSVGLFDYPVLMTSDIVLYGTTHVPVGDDQKQHVELARDIAERFNNKYGDTFVLPTPDIASEGARIMSLTDPTKKMSKSDPSDFSRIAMTDSPDVIRQKLQKAVTGSSSSFDNSAPGAHNLAVIYSACAGVSIDDTLQKFEGKGYKDVKEMVSEAVIAHVSPIQAKYQDIRESAKLLDVLHESAQKAHEISHKKLREVYEKVGFVL